jgi:hypothetical protein
MVSLAGLFFFFFFCFLVRPLASAWSLFSLVAVSLAVGFAVVFVGVVVGRFKLSPQTPSWLVLAAGCVSIVVWYGLGRLKAG